MIRPTMQNNQNIMNQANLFRQNPLGFLLQHKIDIPNEYANNPQGAVQYLMNTGQMSQQDFEILRARASQMGVTI